MAKADGGASTAAAHSGGAKLIFSDNWQTFNDIEDAIATKADIAGEVFTGKVEFSGTTHAGLQANSLTTAQRDALTPVNGDLIYNSSAGEFQVYQGGAWSTVSSGSTQPDGSTTVAGKYEEATLAEQGSATATGGTGARLVPAVANLVKTSSGAGDENKMAVLNASGQFADGFINAADFTTKSTLTAKGSIYGASAASTPAELAVGTNGQVLVAASGEATGLNWKNATKLVTTVLTPVTVSNTTTETDLVSVSIPANTLGTTGAINAYVYISAAAWTTGDGATLTLRLKYGATTIASAVITKNTSGRALSGLGGAIQLNLIANASTSAQIGSIDCRLIQTRAFDTDPSPARYAIMGGHDQGTAAEDSTGALTMALSAQWSAADAGYTITMNNAIIEALAA